MYWKSGDYPEFKSLEEAEQRRIVADALRARGCRVNWRFWIAGPVLVAGPVAGAVLADWPLVGCLAAVVVSGPLLCAYLLWEVNGPVHRAVRAYLSRKSTP
jgi:hypothetical protein